MKINQTTHQVKYLENKTVCLDAHLAQDVDQLSFLEAQLVLVLALISILDFTELLRRGSCTEQDDVQ